VWKQLRVRRQSTGCGTLSGQSWQRQSWLVWTTSTSSLEAKYCTWELPLEPVSPMYQTLSDPQALSSLLSSHTGVVSALSCSLDTWGLVMTWYSTVCTPTVMQDSAYVQLDPITSLLVALTCVHTRPCTVAVFVFILSIQSASLLPDPYVCHQQAGIW